jgi:predicted ribosomally synthesized peptide with nif11-like leader
MKNLNGQEAILALFTEAGNNENLFRQIETATGPEDLVKLGLENGYQFGAAEVQEFMQARSEEFLLGEEKEDYELSEFELEVVAGGTCSLRTITGIAAAAAIVSVVSNGRSSLCS